MIIKAETQQKKLVEVDASELVRRVSAYGVLLKDNEVLVIKTHSDNWELPGGTPELGETLQQGMKRELQEEVGIDAEIGRMFYVRESFYHTPSGKNYHSLQFYFMITTQQSPVLAEAKEFNFLPIMSLTKDNTNLSTYLALQQLANGMSYRLWDADASV